MPINTNTLASGTPETHDGRRYPDYLRAYERYDSEFLPQIDALQEPTLNRLAISAASPKLRSVVSPWLASAEWRGLLTRTEGQTMIGNRRYRLSGLGRERLAELN